MVTVGKDIPVNGTQENYEEYPYIVAVIEMLSAWKNKNYGKLSSYLQKMFFGTLSEKKRADFFYGNMSNRLFIFGLSITLTAFHFHPVSNSKHQGNFLKIILQNVITQVFHSG